MNMNYTAIDGIRTVEDLKAEKNQPVGGGDLDRNAFLRIFTTQLQNQNPLDPMKNEAFVAQLAQFSTLEATYAMSDSLGNFVNSQQSERMLRGSNLLGKQIFAPGVSMEQKGGEALEGVVRVKESYDNLKLNVVNADTGELVNQMELGPQTAGDFEFTWNGGNFDGEAAPAGNYRFQAIGSLGEESVEVPVLAQSRIKGVSWDESMGEIFVEIADGRSIALNEITHISE